MEYDSRRSVEAEVRSILTRRKNDERRLIDDLVDLVLKAFEAGEDEGKRRERRHGGLG